VHKKLAVFGTLMTMIMLRYINVAKTVENVATRMVQYKDRLHVNLAIFSRVYECVDKIFAKVTAIHL